ncbi:MAG TPA: Flp pilus assembly protein CpaB [Rhizomicrobium sp.]|jgi:pilus assembly protein CpaB|nr:Flp pilus assembly protein CpaB [Rhizomicrobium sp.]
MDRTRIIVLAVAAVAAGAVALLARSLLGGGTPQTVAAPGPHIVMSDVLVAAGELTPGSQLTPASVRWQNWPSTSVDSSFITRASAPDISKVVKGAVVRAPMMPGEPFTTTKIVHADAAGFMAAQLMPGMRAISFPITVDTGAGGFILPNDRVDILSTQPIGETHRYRTSTILSDVRVLAVDQTFESKDSKTVVGRTATVELSPDQVETIERAKAGGSLSLALRALGDSGAEADAKSATKAKPAQSTSNEIAVIRYSIERPSVVGSRE